MSRTVVVFSTKGGSGTSTITLNAAVSLSLQKKRVLLVSLDLEAPLDIARMCNIQPKKCLVDMLSVWERIKDDKEGMQATFFTQLNPHLDFLQSVLSARTIPHLKADFVGKVCGLFKEMGYDFIIIDGGNSVTDILIKIFDNANLLLLVVTPDVLSLYQTEWVIDTLQSLGFPLTMIKGVLNRSESKGSVSINDVRSIVPVDILFQVPSDGRTAGLALNRGNPLVLDSPHSRISATIASLAQNLLDEGIFISHTKLTELRTQKEEKAVKKRKSADVWQSLGLVEPLREVKINKETDAIVSLKTRIHRQLVDEMNLKRMPLETIAAMDVEQSQKLRAQAEKILTNLIAREAHGFISSYEVRQKLIREIIDEALGFGPLEDLIRDASVTEIMVNNKDQIYIEREGKLILTSKRFTSDTQVRIVIERILAPLGRRIDESSPYVDARLPDGSRVNAIIPPLSLTGPTLTIRKFAKQRLTVEDLITRFGSLTEDMAKFLQACVISRKNMLVSGGTGSGKTTFLNILSEFIPDRERIITIEDSAELKLHHQHWIRLESRPPNIEGKGEVAIRDLFRNTLRMRPDRIIAGECRGKEVLDMLQAMNTGHDGSMSTIHANSTQDVLIRLDSMILMSGVELPIRAIREMVSSALDVIVHTTRMSDGTRKVVQVTEMLGMLDETTINLKDIFTFHQKGISDEGKVLGSFSSTGYIPSFYDEICTKGISLPKEMFIPKG